MAKKRSGGRKGKKRSGHRRSSHRRTTHKRRRNPPETFGSRLGFLAGAGIVAMIAGTAEMWIASKLPSENTAMHYAVPVVGVLAGVAMAKKMPMIGAGTAIGSIALFTPVLAGKVLSPAGSSTTAALGRAARSMRSLGMGAVDQSMGAVDRSMGRAHAYG